MLTIALEEHVVELKDAEGDLLELYLGEFMLDLVDPKTAWFLPVENL